MLSGLMRRRLMRRRYWMLGLTASALLTGAVAAAPAGGYASMVAAAMDRMAEPFEFGTGALGVTLESDGAHYDLIKIPAGGSRRPFAEDVPVSETRMTMSNGRAVFNRAVDMMAYASLATLEVAGSAIDEVTHWVPHQANSRIISAAQDRLDIDDARVLTSVREFGNSSAATIPFTMSLHRKRLKQGDLLLLTAVGAGLTGGAVLYRL